MTPGCCGFGFGVQRLLDAHQGYTGAGFPVYLRLRNFPAPEEVPAIGLGFRLSPGTAAAGTTDVLIVPSPSVTMVSVHNIGQSDGKLRFGARTFLVSATFTDAQVAARQLADQTLVWRSSDVVGLVTENLLFSIEDITHQEVDGKTVSWVLTCNASELPQGSTITGGGTYAGAVYDQSVYG